MCINYMCQFLTKKMSINILHLYLTILTAPDNVERSPQTFNLTLVLLYETCLGGCLVGTCLLQQVHHS